MNFWVEVTPIALALAAVVYTIVWRGRKLARERDRYAQQWVERRAAELLGLDDAGAAQAIRDELVTRGVDDPRAYAWATDATVARVRRMANLAAAQRGTT